jgi:tetratricopeptide (TPR) repeat protein
MRRLTTLALGLVLVGSAGAARAEKAQAEALFQQGLAASDAGDIATACARFAESEKQDPSAGTLLSLADCHAKQGKTASAWAEFQEAAVLAAHASRQAHHDEAVRRATELERIISYLTVTVQAPVPGLEISLGDIPIGEGAYGVRLPVDPGPWQLIARAPGYETWTQQIRIGTERDDQKVAIPALKQRATTRPAGPAPSDKPTASKPLALAHEGHDSAVSRAPAFVAGGTGAVLTIAGAALGLLAIHTYHRANDACPKHTDCSSSALALRSSAEMQANLSNAGLALGVVGLAVGAVLFISSRPSHEDPMRTALVVQVGPSTRVGITGAFW